MPLLPSLEDNYPEYYEDTFGFRWNLDHLSAHKRARLWALGRGRFPGGDRHPHWLGGVIQGEWPELGAEDELETVAMAHALLRQGQAEAAAQMLMPLIKEETFHPDVAWDEVVEFVVTTLAACGRQQEAVGLCQLASSKLPGWSRETLIRGAVALFEGHHESARTWFAEYVEAEEFDELERRYEVALRWAGAGEHAEAREEMEALGRRAQSERNFGVLVDVQLWLGAQASREQQEE